MKILLIVALVVSLSLCVVTGIANTYPQGEVYATGGSVLRSDISLREVPEYGQKPSPSSNPEWVRMFQNTKWFVPVGIFGVIISFYYLSKMSPELPRKIINSD
jgi:hypothetical protein